MGMPHPGVILKAELDENEISQKELASAIGKTPSVVNGIIKGERDFNAEIALLVSAVLTNGPTSQEWMDLQSSYDLKEVAQKSLICDRLKAIAAWNEIRRSLKLNLLRKRLYMDDDVEENVSEIFESFGASTLDEFTNKLLAYQECFKKSEKVQTDHINLLTWIALVRCLCLRHPIPINYDVKKMSELREKLNAIFYENKDTINRVQSLLPEYGIGFLCEQKRIEKVPVDGYSFVLNGTPYIVVTLRMDRIDNLAFTVMHELGHVELHLFSGGGEDFVDLDRSIQKLDSREDQANKYATSALWSGDVPENVFKQIRNPYAAASVLKRISASYKIGIGVVVGQFQHYCGEHNIIRNPYAVCRDLIQKIN